MPAPQTTHRQPQQSRATLHAQPDRMALLALVAHTRVVNHQIVLGVGNVAARHGGFGHEGVHRAFGQTKRALRHLLRRHLEIQGHGLA